MLRCSTLQNVRTFGDSTKTPGQHINDRCYILAQFSENSNLDWAYDLRAALGGGELKYGKYLELRHLIQANQHLWKKVLSGTAEATIVVIENRFYIEAIAYSLASEGAELGHDVAFEDILREAALCMIDHAPIMRLQDLEPTLLSGVIPRCRYQPHQYTPAIVYERIGHKFNDAATFAARAHAIFDLDCLKGAASTNELFQSPHRRALLLDIGAVDRVFDKEHPKSAAMLDEMLTSLEFDRVNSGARQHRISESSSDSHEALQAADFCAGLASEIMMNASDDRERALRSRFRRVIFNGSTR